MTTRHKADGKNCKPMCMRHHRQWAITTLAEAVSITYSAARRILDREEFIFEPKMGSTNDRDKFLYRRGLIP